MTRASDPIESGPLSRAIARALGTLDVSRARVLKREGDHAVFACELAGVACVVKTIAPRTWRERLAGVFALSRLHRQRRGAMILQRLGVPTARPLALVRRAGPNGPEILLALERLDGPTLLRLMADRTLGARAEHALARAVARNMARLLAGGYFNRDHKPANLIVTSVQPGHERVAMIDTVAIRRCGDEGAIRMLASLYLEPLGCGVPPRRALMMRVVRTLADAGLGRPTRQLWMYAGNVVRNHPHPAAPKIDPLQTHG